VIPRMQFLVFKPESLCFSVCYETSVDVAVRCDTHVSLYVSSKRERRRTHSSSLTNTDSRQYTSPCLPTSTG